MPLGTEEKKQTRRWPDDYSTEEIKRELGSFEQEYLSHLDGERVGGPGYWKGIQEWAIENGWLARKGNNIALVQYSDNSVPWLKLYHGMRELQYRREYAKKQEHLEFNQGRKCEGECDMCNPPTFNKEI